MRYEQIKMEPRWQDTLTWFFIRYPRKKLLEWIATGLVRMGMGDDWSVPLPLRRFILEHYPWWRYR